MRVPARISLALAVMGVALIAASAALNLFQAETRRLQPIRLVSTPRVAVRADSSSSFVLLPRDRDALESNGDAATGALTDTWQIVGRLPRAGSPAPDFTLRTLEGGSITLSELRGHPVMINFWTAWRPACRREAPALQALYAEFAPRGLILFGVLALPTTLFIDSQGVIRDVVLGEMSHGCVNLPTGKAARLFKWAPLGATVVVR